MYSVTCVGNRSIVLIRFSSNVFKLIVITITSDVLIFDINFVGVNHLRKRLWKACFLKGFNGNGFALAKST